MTKRGKIKIKKGIVVSNKMRKTVVVKVVRVFRHPEYHKVVRMANTFKAHDEKNECSIGDQVEIVETRPMSKDKYFRVARILVKAIASPKEEKVDTAA